MNFTHLLSLLPADSVKLNSIQSSLVKDQMTASLYSRSTIHHNGNIGREPVEMSI